MTVNQRERQQAALTIQRETHEAEITRLRDSVIALERRRAAAQPTVRQIRSVGALHDQLRSAFPELGGSAWGLTKPRIRLGSAAVGLLAAEGGGFVAGRLVP